ncbi:MAG: hypothetical protein EBZ48_04120, partial [Proteobacteria bacterium]|nr:hypothetical protein [Pseudomonadota bacterium]
AAGGTVDMNPEQLVRTHFWVTSQPFCEAVLFISPQTLGAAQSLSLEGTASVALLRLFDSDGGVVTEAQCGSANGAPVMLELDALLEGCKLESGLRHGHLMIEHDASVRPAVRLQNRGGAVLTGASMPVDRDRAMFSPVTLAPERASLLTLVNFGAGMAEVRVRLMVGNRNPDLVYNLPPFGSRVVCLEQEFRQALMVDFAKGDSSKGQPRRGVSATDAPPTFSETRGYVRVSVRNEQTVGVQLVESIERADQGTVFSALSW